MQQLEEVIRKMKEKNFPQSAVSHFSGLPGPHLSTWLRGLDEPTPTCRDRVLLTVRAMERVQEKAGVPINWSRPVELRQAIEETIIKLRAERSEELRRQFEKSLTAPDAEEETGPDVAEILGTEDGCSCR